MLKNSLKIILTLLLLALAPKAYAANEQVRGFLSTEDFVLNFQDQTFKLPKDELNKMSGMYLVPVSSNIIYHEQTTEQLRADFLSGKIQTPKINSTVFHFDPEAIYKFVSQTTNAVAKAPVEPKLGIKNNFAVIFSPPSDGIFVDASENTLKLLNSLENNQSSMDLDFSSSSPKSLLSDTNSLGINELIATGVSNFKGSPNNRRHNIKVGVGKFKGLIIQKGEEFSFNKYLGPVEEEQGFLPELVIKKSGTVPELGGGLCQVSSTTFRAAMEAGLPITQRKNHSYAVQYYAPQGTDATIYPGVIDLKFKNDTPGAILVWPHFEGKDDLIFDFYGTKDNRLVTLEKPRTYDRKTDGSMKAEWTRIVEKDGVTSSSTFKSIYQSPALFHKEETFVTAAPTPTPTPILSPTPQTN